MPCRFHKPLSSRPPSRGIGLSRGPYPAIGRGLSDPLHDEPLALQAPLRPPAHVLERGGGVVTEGVGLLHCPEKVMQLLQVASNLPKSAQNLSPDPSRGPSDAVFHPGSVSEGPGARKRPPGAETDETPGTTIKKSAKQLRYIFGAV